MIARLLVALAVAALALLLIARGAEPRRAQRGVARRLGPVFVAEWAGWVVVVGRR